jgi:ribose transport system substrate-binding protein
MKHVILLAAAAGLALAGSAVAQEKKVLAIVVKGLDNGFFTVMGSGCDAWNKAHPDSEYECFFTGPALTSDEAGEIQIVQDLLAKPNTAGMAISPSNAPAMAKTLREAKPTIPIITVDADVKAEDKDVRAMFFGSSNTLMGETMADWAMKLRPTGGSVCLQLGNPAAANLNERAQGFRDKIAGAKGTERLTGQGGWTEVEGCPLYTNDDIALANQQLSDVLTAHPDLNAFILTGGWAQQGTEAYAATFNQVKARLDSKDLIVVAGDALVSQRPAFRNGLSHVNVAQKPDEMGNRSPDFLIDLINGKPVVDPTYTGFNMCTPDDAGICATDD